MVAHVEQIYTACMSQAAYFLESDGEAVVIDPLRDPAPYMERAASRGARIKYVIETHFHADFVSGHTDLAQASGATIVFGPTAQPTFDALIATDGEELRFGKARLRVLHTPGHTLESACFVLYDDGSDTPRAVFTGDTVFIGDVGRPDLAQLVADTTQERQARLLYRSIREKILPLPDSVIVYPGHGAGSACGKNLSSETSDTLGNQKKTNYALDAGLSEDDFVHALLEGLREPPGYFQHQVVLNKGQAGPFADAIARGKRHLTVGELKEQLAKGVLVLDYRHHQPDFAACHIPGTIYAGTSGSLALWVATVFANVHQPYAIVNDDQDFEDGLYRLTRVGFDNCLGHLKGGMEAWKAAGEPTASIEYATADELAADVGAPDRIQIFDVRGPGEYRNGHLAHARNAPLCERRPTNFAELVAPDKKAYMYCVSGYRALMYITLCRRAGVTAPMYNVKGGIGAIKSHPTLSAMIETRDAH